MKGLFLELLHHRGFTGKIKADHEQSQLELVISPIGSTSRNMKQLSGGEKSFSTVCFLLSLWGATDCPFHALDEYDVYMDAVNRRISTALIIEAARNAKDRQFILISPQDMRYTKLFYLSNIPNQLCFCSLPFHNY